MSLEEVQAVSTDTHHHWESQVTSIPNKSLTSVDSEAEVAKEQLTSFSGGPDNESESWTESQEHI